MFILIAIFVPVALGWAVFAGGNLNNARISAGFMLAIAAFVAIILGVAAIHPPGDYRHHRAPTHQGGGL